MSNDRTARRTALLALFAALALAGCVAPPPTAKQLAAAAKPVLGLGAQQIDRIRAARLFDAICRRTAPDFAQAPAALRRLDFLQDPKSGHYRNRVLDVKVILRKEECLMAFASQEDPVALGAFMLAEGTKDNTARVKLLTLDPRTGLAGGPGPKATRFNFDRWENTDGRRIYAATLVFRSWFSDVPTLN